MTRILTLVFLLAAATIARPQPPNARIGEAVPRDVRELYDKGLQYLVKTQNANGEWTGGQNGSAAEAGTRSMRTATHSRSAASSSALRNPPMSSMS